MKYALVDLVGIVSKCKYTVSAAFSLHTLTMNVKAKGLSMISDIKAFRQKVLSQNAFFHPVMQEKRCDIRYYVVVIRSHSSSLHHYLFQEKAEKVGKDLPQAVCSVFSE